MGAFGKVGNLVVGHDEFGLPVFLTAQNLRLFITKELAENSKPVRLVIW